MRTLKADLLVTPALRALSASSVIGGLPQASAPTTWCIHRPSCSVAVRSASCSLLSFAKLGNALVTRRPKEKPVPPDGFRYILKSPRRARQSWQPWPSSRERERERSRSCPNKGAERILQVPCPTSDIVLTFERAAVALHCPPWRGGMY